jgi:hypothetical protein
MAEEGPLVVRCAAHPDVETALRCGRCDTPICPRCLVMTPVGARCRACAQLRKSPIYDVRLVHYLRAIGAGLAVAVVGSYVVPFIPFFGLILLGWAVGEAVTRAANRKRGTGLAVVAVASLFVGVIVVPELIAVAGFPAFVPVDTRLNVAAGRMLGHLFSIWGLFLAIAAVIAVSRVR